jgi:hypothetical protein
MRLRMPSPPGDCPGALLDAQGNTFAIAEVGWSMKKEAPKSVHRMQPQIESHSFSFFVLVYSAWLNC